MIRLVANPPPRLRMLNFLKTKKMDLDKIAKDTIERVKGRIFRKILELGENWEQVYLSRTNLQRLTDEEFILLWMLPDIEIRISKKTTAYVQERRNLLGLRSSEHSGVRKEDPPPRKPYLDEWDEVFGS